MNKHSSDDLIGAIFKAERERMARLGEVAKSAAAHFENSSIHEFVIAPQGSERVLAFVFFRTDSDLEQAKANGFVDLVMKYVVAQLERIGEGNRNEPNVMFELDSDENVQKNYGGSYYSRMN